MTAPFTPRRWLRNRHAMTIFANVATPAPPLPLRRERWELPDGDFLDVDRLTESDRGLLVVCHGLEGSSRASYVGHLMAEARSHGLGSVALNFRGCSGELNRLPRFYHSGETEDLAFALDRLSAEAPGRPIVLAGFSLGGNVVVKYLGERGDNTPVKAAAVVSVPFDLEACADTLDGRALMAKVYRERFLRRLRAKTLQKAHAHPTHFNTAATRRARTLRQFDDAVTAPLHGFRDAVHYWTSSSSKQFLPAIRRPLLILAAEDDPFIPPSAIPRAEAASNPHITLEIHPHGGHVGFVDGPFWKPRRYAEARVADFLAPFTR